MLSRALAQNAEQLVRQDLKITQEGNAASDVYIAM